MHRSLQSAAAARIIAGMTPTDRFLLRLRRRLLRGYELLLYALLLALAGGTVLAAGSGAGPGDHCGSIQSTMGVITT